MSAASLAPTRRSFLATFSAVASVLGLAMLAAPGCAPTGPAADAEGSVISLLPTKLRAAVEADAVRPFRINVPEEALVDLRRRITATRWPDQENVNDRSQGAQLAKIQPFVNYWGTDYNWRNVEGKLNSLPNFMATIDGVDIHFIHVRSPQPDALPMIMTHGWPGFILELVKVIGPLTDPTAHGGQAQDAFHMVVPSMPGYGFSGKPPSPGWGPDHIARAWAELMGRLGYERYVSQGGDWGSVVTDAMAAHAPAGLLGIHVNMPATVPPGIARALALGEPAPAGLWRSRAITHAR
jgi:Epoxide hydrolase N terminus